MLTQTPPVETKTTENFKQILTTLAIFENLIIPGDPHILMGIAKHGPCKTRLISPGGKVNEGEKNLVEAAQREAEEECGLRGMSNMHVGEVQVSIRDLKLLFIIHIVIFTHWTGELKPNEEFESLDFIRFSQIPLNLLPLRDEEWLGRMLIDCKPTLAKIECGKDRDEVLGFTMEDWSYNK